MLTLLADSPAAFPPLSPLLSTDTKWGCDKAGVDVEVYQNVCKRGSLTTKERTGRRRDREHEKEAEY